MLRNTQRFDAQERALNAALASSERASQAALAAADKASIKAETASEKRFEGINEFRNTLRDQQNTYITRTEVETKIAGAISTIGPQGKYITRNEVYALVGVAATLGGLAGHFLK